MSNEAKLGTTPAGPEGRDAVHIAIVACRAGKNLAGGTPVKLDEKNEAITATSYGEAVGVVDPFRRDGVVLKGEWFWLCLFPQTTTGLRHVWSHPSFPEGDSLSPPPAAAPTYVQKAESRAWLTQYVKDHCPYWLEGPYSNVEVTPAIEEEACNRFLENVKDEKIIYYAGRDLHSLDELDDAEELFHHLSVLLDMRIDAGYFKYFTCSC